MRNIKTRLFLSIVLIAIVFLANSLYQTWSWTQDHIKELVDQQNQLSLAFDKAIRDYIGKVVRPEMSKRVGEKDFFPETMSTSFVARSIFSKVTAGMPHVVLKFSSENPRNPVNRATPEEREIITYFRNHPEDTTWSGKLTIDGKQYYARANARRMEMECLKCHGIPDDAPAALLERYGHTAGFGRSVGDVSLDLVAFQVEKATVGVGLMIKNRILFSLGALILFFAGIIYFIWKDVEERKRAEEELRKSEKKFRSVVESSPTGMYFYHLEADGQLILTGRNPTADRIIGMSHQTLIGKTIEEAFPALVGTEIPDMYRKIARGELAIQTFELPYRDERLAGLYDVYAFQTGPSTIAVDFVDISERKEAEIKINESRDFLENIFKTSADGILIVGKYSIITMANEAAEKILGYPKQELTGKALTDFDVPGDSYDKKGIEFITRLFEEGSVKCFERQYVHKDGHVVDVELSAAVRKDLEGNIIDSVAVLRDITERKRADEEKKKLEAQLSRSEKMETIGLLAGGVAHDLNNMLGAIVGYPELLLDDLPLDSPLRPAIKAIKESGERAAAIVQDLLTLTRRGVAVNEIINLNAVVRKYFESREWEKLKEFHPEITVQQHLDPTLLNLVGSPVHLSKVIANLMSNSAEAMPRGGTIKIITENRHLDTPLKGYDKIAEGDYSVLSVSDNGIGIPADDLQRIFEPFYTKKVMGRSGTGLGMSVVWGTVKDHGGYIDIVSKQGEGTIMTLYFSATRKEINKQETAFSLESYIGNGETILVIDDIESQRDVAKAILTKLRYRVETVKSGEEALAYLKTFTADLLVLDMIMDPGMDGLETYRKILELHPHQKAIIASGYSETDRVKNAQELGAGAYVKKPYTIEKLGQAVKNELLK